MKARQVEEAFRQQVANVGLEKAIVHMFVLMQEQINDVNKGLLDCAHTMAQMTNVMDQQHDVMGVIKQRIERNEEDLGTGTQVL